MTRLAAIALVLALADAAWAETSETAEARRRFQIARRHHELGRFEAAVQEYLLVHELEPMPDILFNIAQCYRNLGDLERAIFFFERYLEVAGAAPDRPRIRELIHDLETQLERERLAAVTATVTAEPEPPAEPLPEVVPGPPPVSAVVLNQAPPPTDDGSILTAWWFWTAVGAVVVAGSAAAVAVTAAGGPEGTIATIDAR